MTNLQQALEQNNTTQKTIKVLRILADKLFGEYNYPIDTKTKFGSRNDLQTTLYSVKGSDFMPVGELCTMYADLLDNMGL
jgi:hypothetical protein